MKQLRIDLTGTWPDALKEEFEERAGIMEFTGNMSRESAERMAYELLLPIVKQYQEWVASMEPGVP